MKFEDGSKMRKKLQVGRLAHLFHKDLIFSQALEPSLRENDSAFGKSIIHQLLIQRKFLENWNLGRVLKNTRFMTSPSFLGPFSVQN